VAALVAAATVGGLVQALELSVIVTRDGFSSDPLPGALVAGAPVLVT